MQEIKHWAESLQAGDRVLGTIRHKTDGSLNRHGVELIVVQVIAPSSQILAYDVSEGKTIPVPFNELTKVEMSIDDHLDRVHKIQDVLKSRV